MHKEAASEAFFFLRPNISVSLTWKHTPILPDWNLKQKYNQRYMLWITALKRPAGVSWHVMKPHYRSSPVRSCFIEKISTNSVVHLSGRVLFFKTVGKIKPFVSPLDEYMLSMHVQALSQVRAGAKGRQSFMFPISSSLLHWLWQDSTFPHYKDLLQQLPHLRPGSITECWVNNSADNSKFNTQGPLF